MIPEPVDWCTSFPEYWYQWYLGRYYIPMWRKIYIGGCCKIHDDKCSTRAFISCLWDMKIVGGAAITGVAAAACLVKYRKV